MLWIMGLAVLLAVGLPLLGWNSPYRQALAVWSGGLGCLLFMLLPVSAVAVFIGAFGYRAEALDVISVLAFGPPLFLVALELNFFILVQDRRWGMVFLLKCFGVGLVSWLLILGGVVVLGSLHSASS